MKLFNSLLKTYVLLSIISARASQTELYTFSNASDKSINDPDKTSQTATTPRWMKVCLCVQGAVVTALVIAVGYLVNSEKKLKERLREANGEEIDIKELKKTSDKHSASKISDLGYFQHHIGLIQRANQEFVGLFGELRERLEVIEKQLKITPALTKQRRQRPSSATPPISPIALAATQQSLSASIPSPMLEPTAPLMATKPGEPTCQGDIGVDLPLPNPEHPRHQTPDSSYPRKLQPTGAPGVQLSR